MGARPFVERNAKKRARVLKGIEIATRAREIAFVRVVSREHDDARTNARRAMTSRSDTLDIIAGVKSRALNRASIDDWTNAHGMDGCFVRRHASSLNKSSMSPALRACIVLCALRSCFF